MRNDNRFTYGSGRMISGTKKAPEGHECVWNGNLCTKEAGKIWFGDIDLTADKAELQALADQRAESVYVLREYDARFTNEDRPIFDRAVAVFHPTQPLTQ